MSQPKTLMEMAGADMTPNALSDSALVLIDCQMEYVSGAVPLPGVAEALVEAGKVLARARAANAPIVHIVHQGQAGSVFDLDGAGGQIAPQVASAAGEAVIRKELPNAFAATGLHDKLREVAAKNLIFVGFMTHMCVSASVRAALDLGYRSTIVGAAAATRDLPTPSGGVIDAASLHEASLAALGDRFAIIVETADQLPA
ncbi:MAG: cysteine hydrolase family protein [Alphaproteobacteria bacterium]|jgi:nicotinamidase-related amidase|nr:cysteine hydrolase family protein [Alphaproteobacteria bacterium]MDP6818709.1 cysteine hydrolase family protein [Alphaproteobacteria bacterium]